MRIERLEKFTNEAFTFEGLLTGAEVGVAEEGLVREEDEPERIKERSSSTGIGIPFWECQEQKKVIE